MYPVTPAWVKGRIQRLSAQPFLKHQPTRIPCACGVLAMCTLYLSSHSLFHMASALSSSRSDRVSSAQSSDRHEALEAVTEYTKNPFHPPLPSSAPATTRFYAKRL
ncbi:hypothetical protein Q8A67_025464 [Cirrhinus molitorella]|uniref:Uncharacterized protein n=1 Tax=Cirrhinus molitorella TaxID=172907 RepID=A0AA88NUP2_9TELE|nr:hypothetical protein Q8A67_025464 [Cirrhinus molitorella]